MRCDAHSADVFEVRGTHRTKRGERLPDQNGDDYLMCYRGLDERERRARVRWSRHPDKVDNARAAFLLRLESKESATIVISVSSETDAEAPRSPAPIANAVYHALSSPRAP